MRETRVSREYIPTAAIGSKGGGRHPAGRSYSANVCCGV
jgi:hypothetical protein